MNNSEDIYNENIKINKEKSNSLKVKINTVSIIRLGIVILCILTNYFLYKNNNVNMMLFTTIVFIGLFLFFIYFHDLLFNKKKKIDLLININKDGLNRINGDLNKIEDGGEEYLDVNHPFSDDLDIFGSNSLFKIINTSATIGGRKRLVGILKRDIIFNENEILERQKAIKEISKKIDWRQKLIVEGHFKEDENHNIDEFIKWSEQDQKTNSTISIIAIIFIAITIISVFAALKGIVPESFILLDLMVNYIAVKTMTKNLKNEIKLFESIKNSMTSYSKVLELIQEEDFNSNYLNELQRKLISNKKSKHVDFEELDCKLSIKKLSNIFSWIGDSKYNAYYFIINITLFSDVFLIRNIEKWKLKNGKHLRQWLEVMYKVDEMCSFASLDFEHEAWCYPQISVDKVIEGVNIGHPLLSKKCIKNDFSLKENNTVALITGSNMSGKSTFLRTIGINMILSYTGGPVCAEKFICGIMNLYTCMRTKDNLEESISSFYAEILRIKLLIDAAKRGERVFFLLDEIFKGTNSEDRHAGASILIKQLIEYKGMGIVSTHDLELCDLEKENSSIINYNFREFYENNKIKFDYILRRGKSETRNAVHLMRLAGIDIN
ncbi:MutS family DNA mismatch repair protein [Clostridium butyricum]|uniref:MutS family DNA mismatch repair protein n=1 Tax=Clostridium butyricum TaxID=1492 RepID=UPI00374F5033